MAQFDYPLPADRIAQVPIEPRDAARLMVAVDPDGGVDDRAVADLPELVGPGDLLVVNETRVIPARLALRKATGGAAEVLLLERTADGSWLALARPGRRLPPGTVLCGAGGLEVEVGERLPGGRRAVRLRPPVGRSEDEAISAAGVLPLPPYIHQSLADPDRYQTVYATRPGSVAAPTAGLHLTDAVIAACRARGADVATVDLAVGLDTFRPVTADRWADHVMHTERYAVPEETLAACRSAARVIAVGTTTVRALEAAVSSGERQGRTDLFITPGFEFRAVDVLLTNFHLPRSSLLLLLAAFAGDRWRSLYDRALAGGYRFLSFGDAMLVGRA
jgi:S-adenosylmethionine:tRNA ribosyltransferase-isomerase